jgi:predicted PurR-regulated permease PerM
MSLYHDRVSIAILFFCGLIFISAGIAFLPVMDASVFAVTIAVVLMPVKKILARRISERKASLLIVFLLLISVLVLITLLLLIIYGISDYAGEMFDKILLWVDNHDSIQSVPMSDNIASDVLFGEDGFLSGIIHSIINSVIYSGFRFIIFFVLLYLFLKDGERILERLKGILPQRSLEILSVLEIKGKDTLYAVYIVQFVTSAVTFFLALPFFYLLGFENVIELSVIAAIFQLIPVIGPSIMMVILAFYSVSVGDYTGALLLAGIGYPVVCAFPDLVLRPVLMGRRTLVHPAVMWIGFFGGIYIFGMSGLVLGPLLLALMITAAGILINSEKMKNNRIIPERFRKG